MELKNDYNLTVGLQIREALRMTREQFSEICDAIRQFLADIERGKKITIKTLNKICTGAKCRVQIVFLGINQFCLRALLLKSFALSP